MTEENEYIMVDNCCMKQNIKDFIKSLINKPLTELEATILCIYQIIFTATISIALIQFKIAAKSITLILSDFIPTYMITLIALFINTMIIIQMICQVKEFISALFCKCDYRMHPELE
jgi:hypothetical protein